ncbi:MAG: glycosyltransferase [Blastocatellia bacterium]|nr:glycosyltransferase [Blastocatellia bacterium]
METNPCVSIVIPNWNGLALLKQFLPSVIASAQTYASHSHALVEILIVDDGSTDQSVAWLLGEGFEERKDAGERGSNQDAGTRRRGDAAKEYLPPTTDHRLPTTGHRNVDLCLIRNEKNRGFGYTCNRGFAAARHGLVFLLNNDVEVNAEAIFPLVEQFQYPDCEGGGSVFAVHCRVFEFESGEECGTGKLGGFRRGFIRVHRSYASAREDGATRDTPLYSMFASGGSAMFDRRKFLELGGFEPLLAPIYWEDVEISYRAWKRGFVVLYEPRSEVRHRVSSTMRKVHRRKVRCMQQRNRLIFHWINLHDPFLMASHAAWVMLLAITSPLLLKPGFLLSCIAALSMLPRIVKRRREEREAAKLRDRDVFDIFKALERRPYLFAYDDYSELKQFQEITQAGRGAEERFEKDEG